MPPAPQDVKAVFRDRADGTGGQARLVATAIAGMIRPNGRFTAILPVAKQQRPAITVPEPEAWMD